ncbi:CDP-alcohol phosphatidyltransferase domain-containing protein [Rhizoctonia solani AG-1 IA]|uniref:CDP-alcohol phosphatidyltransferase domain-containing protein n=1 Tax=Thanatephorus cucumeris (strain AG1-IA) TaxID=983506 RepID=L8WKL3_THACA|nr:CDP-alcohol phosphatidyltransferase domain-containing protein [Rhizoctonia solani AG-1 IA]
MDNPRHDPYLTKESLDNLRWDSTRCDTGSLFDTLNEMLGSTGIRPSWWDHAATYFPSWMAPNLITLSGLSFVIINVACIALYEPDLKTPGPTWLQARKTGTSSALGHVFDHGIDTLNCPLGGLVQVASLGLGHSINGAFFVLVGCVPMWLSTWEEYYTGTLYLGYINGPTEGILIAIGVHLISAFFGPGFWHNAVDLPGFIPWLSRPVTLIESPRINPRSSFLSEPNSFMNVHAACKSKGISFISAISQNLSFGIYVCLCWIWVASPYSALLSPMAVSAPLHGGLIEFTLLVVCTFGRMLPRVIIAYLTRGPFPALLPSVVLPLLGGVVIANLGRFGW